MSEPKFTTLEGPRGKLVMCEYEGEIGSARVFSKGEQDARDRAFEQARAKVRERGPAE